jgi:diaminopimelate decarboxylase
VTRAHPAGPRHGDVLVAPSAPAPPASPGWLDPEIWPRGAFRADDGALAIGGVSVAALAEEYGTPAMVMSSDDLRSRARDYLEAFTALCPAGIDIYYAGKAFLASSVVRWLAAEGLSLDVCSGGELALGLAAGMPAERILFHGNNKSAEELAAALEAGVGRIVADSFDELDRLSGLAAELGVVAPVLIRVTLGVEAHTHEFIATAHEDQKFGFSLASGRALAAAGRVLDDPHLRLVGVHSHIGSQIFVASGFEVAARRAVGFLARIRAEHGVELSELNLGGGLGIKYTNTDRPLDVREIAPDIVGIVARECQAAELPVPRLAFEPGRAIAGPSTVTLYRVGTIKSRTLEAGATRTYVSVDGGMSDNIRTALYDAEYTVVLANRVSDAEPMLVRVVGKHCESGDIVIRDAWLPSDLAHGDLLAVAATGAYTRSMASNYNLVPRPPVIAASDGQTSVVLRRETLADLFATDPYLA